MITLFAAAIAPVPPSVPQDLQRDLHCVVVLAVHADPTLKKAGADFAAITGAAIMDATGETRESVREMILTEAAAVRAKGRPAAAEIVACSARMRAALARA